MTSPAALGSTPHDQTTTTTKARSLKGAARLRRRAEGFEKAKHGPATLLSEFIPDALVDSRYQRRKRANKMFGGGDGLACRLLSATNHRLKFVTVPLGPGTAADLYSPKMNLHARMTSRAVFGRFAAWSKLELGLDGGLHLHMLGAADALLMLPKGGSVKLLTPDAADFRRVLAYMVKPADARACMVKVKLGPERYAKPDAALLAAAITDHQFARRAHGRLPRMTWSYNIPLLKPDALLRPA